MEMVFFYTFFDLTYFLGHYDSENGESSTCSTLNKKTLRAPAYAFILPNLEKYPDDFRRFLERDMIEMATLRRLEVSGWIEEVTPLFQS